MKKKLFAMTGILFFCAITNSNAGEVVTPYTMAKEIKFANNLSGSERMLTMEQYVCGLPDAQLITLLNQIGAERFLADLPKDNRNKQKNHKLVSSKSHLSEDMDSASPHARQQQLDTALHTPEHKMRLCQIISNFLLNTAR